LSFIHDNIRIVKIIKVQEDITELQEEALLLALLAQNNALFDTC